MKNVFIKQAKPLEDYRIRFEFTDGHSTELDFHGFLTRVGQNPMAAQFLDITRFKRFRIDAKSDIVWGDWDLAFPFASLYAGDLDVDSLGNRKKVSRKPVRPTKKSPSLPQRSSRKAKTGRTVKIA